MVSEMNSAFVDIPTESGNAKLIWDKVKFSAIIPTGLNECILNYDGISIKVATSASALAHRLDTAIVFRNLINETEADVIAILEGDTHSASSMIALSAHGVEVKPYASMMIHHASFGTYNTVQNVMDHVNFTSSQTERLIRDVYQDFLTPQELDEVVRNREIWLTDEEIGERLDVMFEMRSLRQQESLGENQQPEEHKTLDQMIEEAVSSFYKKLKKDFEITPKVKATKVTKSPSPATA